MKNFCIQKLEKLLAQNKPGKYDAKENRSQESSN
jgi:hypothetical protein